MGQVNRFLKATKEEGGGETEEDGMNVAVASVFVIAGVTICSFS